MSELERLFPGMIRLVTPYEVVEELEELANTQKTLTRRARLALNFINDHCETIQPSQTEAAPKSRVDDIILSLTRELQGIIATNDHLLRKKSRAMGIASVFLRERAYLAVDGI